MPRERKVIFTCWVEDDDLEFPLESRVSHARDSIEEYIGHGSAGDPVIGELLDPIITNEVRFECWACGASPAEQRLPRVRGGPIYGAPPPPDPELVLCDACCAFPEFDVDIAPHIAPLLHVPPLVTTPRCEHGVSLERDAPDCPKCAADLRAMREVR